MEVFQEAEKIYSPQTKEYFKEVLSSYAIGNYRSAIVMLYTVCLCDLVYKLQELKDMYNDGAAKNILNDVEKEKSSSNSKSSWEKTLVDRVFEKTNLLDNDSYTYLNHIYDVRNMSAHPALDRDGELISPPKEIVAAFIRISLEKILLKPAIFSRDIINVLTEDLAEKKDIFIEDQKLFRRYVKNKFLDRMTDAIFKKTFRVFWRFTFNSVNQDCANNRSINYQLLNVMVSERRDLIKDEISSSLEKYEIGKSAPEIGFSVVFMAFHPFIYNLLPEHTKSHVQKACVEKNKYRLLSSFLSLDKRSHLEKLRKNDSYVVTDDLQALKYMYSLYEGDGLKDECLDYFIDVVEDASTYKEAGRRLELYVIPFLKKMTHVHYERIFNIFGTCNQIKNNIHKDSYAQTIWNVARTHMPNYDMMKYPVFFEKIKDGAEDW